MPMTKARAISSGLRDKTDNPMNRCFAPIIAVCLVALAIGQTQAAPLDDIIPRRAGASACFTRTFDDTYLRQHPRQKVTFIAAWMKYEKPKTADELALGFSLAIRRRGERDALFSQGTCEWKADANRDASNNRLIATFPKDEGAACLQSARPDVFDLISAQEGGNLILDRGEKGTLMVYPDESLTMVKRNNRARQLHIVFDKDDRVFQLRRANARDCAFIEEAVTTPEPGARRR
jgi:hypothetical protein